MPRWPGLAAGPRPGTTVVTGLALRLDQATVTSHSDRGPWPVLTPAAASQGSTNTPAVNSLTESELELELQVAGSSSSRSESESESAWHDSEVTVTGPAPAAGTGSLATHWQPPRPGRVHNPSHDVRLLEVQRFAVLTVLAVEGTEIRQN